MRWPATMQVDRVTRQPDFPKFYKPVFNSCLGTPCTFIEDNKLPSDGQSVTYTYTLWWKNETKSECKITLEAPRPPDAEEVLAELDEKLSDPLGPTIVPVWFEGKASGIEADMLVVPEGFPQPESATDVLRTPNGLTVLVFPQDSVIGERVSEALVAELSQVVPQFEVRDFGFINPEQAPGLAPPREAG